MKKIVGVTYEKGLCTGITVDGIIDDNTKPDEPVHFERIVHGYWKPVDYDVVFKCSCCACEVSELWSYCPHCGAKMDGRK